MLSRLLPPLLLVGKCFLVSVCACAAIDGFYRLVYPKQHVYRRVWTPHTLASRYGCSGQAHLWDQAHVKVEVLNRLLMSVCVASLARISQNDFFNNSI